MTDRGTLQECPRWAVTGTRRSNRESCNEGSKACTRPKVVGQIYNDRFGSAANNHPLKGHFVGRINFLVRKPGWDIKKIPGLRRRAKFSSFAPANIRRTTEYIDDRVLL